MYLVKIPQQASERAPLDCLIFDWMDDSDACGFSYEWLMDWKKEIFSSLQREDVSK